MDPGAGGYRDVAVFQDRVAHKVVQASRYRVDQFQTIGWLVNNPRMVS